MRLIDADTFIAYLNEVKKSDDSTFIQIMEIFVNMVEIVAEKEPINQWIPCSERFPKESVLCCDKRGEMIIGMPYKYKTSNTGFSAESDTEYLYDCVAWMPLPEPYKQKE